MKVVSSVDVPFLLKIKDLCKNIDLVFASDRNELLNEVKDAEVLLLTSIDVEILSAAKKCKLIQAISGGVDKFLIPELAQTQIQLTCLKGCFNTAAAEHALALMLAYSRGIHRDLKNMSKKKMGPYRADLQFEIEDKTLGIIGLGEIGIELAYKANALGMEVIGIDIKEPNNKIAIKSFYAMDHLEDFLKVSDFVAVSLPLTDETRGLIGEKEFNIMKKTACLIDVSGRYDIYDYGALENALVNQEISAACMQPGKDIPQDSALWNCENFIFSFHRATSLEQSEKCLKMICENLNRFQNNQSLLGLVNYQSGF